MILAFHLRAVLVLDGVAGNESFLYDGKNICTVLMVATLGVVWSGSTQKPFHPSVGEHEITI